MYSGFCKGIRENMMKALYARYYEQLSQQRFKYMHVLPRDFITHLETKWVFLDEMQVQQLKDEYYKGWSADEHISAFARRLDKDQAKLASDGVTISNVDKNQHYMLQIWKSEMFSQQAMTKWTKRPVGVKTWEHSVPFFEDKALELEQFEALYGGGAPQNGFGSANVATEIQEKLDGAIAVICNNEIKHALAIKAAQGETTDMQEQVAALVAMMKTLTNKINENGPARPH